MTLKPLSAVLILLISGLSAFSQNDYRLMFLGKPELPSENLNHFIQQEVIDSKDVYAGYYYRIIQFYQIPNADEKAKIELQGIKLLDYFPKNAFQAAIPVNYPKQQLAALNIRSITKTTNEQKQSLNMLGDYPNYAVAEAGMVDVRLQFQKNISMTDAQNLASTYGKVLHLSDVNHVVEIRTSQKNIPNIITQPWLYFIDLTAPPSEKEDTKGRSLHRSNAINTNFSAGRKYNGSGVAAALADDGFVGPHIDFTGRITNYSSATGQTHGDMTSGILAGAGNLNPVYRGMADGVQLHVFDISGYTHIIDAVANYNNLGTVVTSTSYSQGCNQYTTDTQFGDQTIHDNGQLEFVFSAGNNNGANCGYGAGNNWGNITGGYKQGKNVIAVANLDALEVIDPTSSIGPASDGRIKPDIAANGRDQMSTDENNTYQTGGGTSAACPGIAGICTQLIQAYKQINAAADAPTALIKAALLNGAEDIGNPGPDFKYGWGRVNSLRAVKTIEEGRYFSGTINQGDSTVHVINVPPGTAQMRVMVYWHDAGGTPAASTYLVNDIDMVVTDPAATTFNPWVLDPTPNPVNLNTPAVRGVDHLNNMEQVTIDNPSAGAYAISLKGFAIPQGPQEYVLVYEFRNDDITVTYPMGGEGFVPGEQELIRWDALKGLGAFNLEYTLDNGQNWNTIASVNQDLLQYAWTVPTSITGEAKIRISRGSVTGMSDSIFTIAGVPQNLNVIYSCVDSVKLGWTTVNGAAWYEVSMLGNKYMDSVATTTNPYYIFTNLNPANAYWFSVRAVMANGNKGRRANAIQKQPGVFNCPNTPPFIQFNANFNSGCIGKTFVFTDQSANAPNNWNWSFSPNTITFVNGTSATSQNPQVQFNAPGTYDVTLTASNPTGSSSLTQTGLININPAAAPPLIEDFQAASFPPLNWLVDASNSTYTWEKSPSITGIGGTPTIAARINNFSYNGNGAEDGLLTYEVDLSNALAAQITFDVAYARYSATYSDTLRIDVSTDCGNTFVPSGYFKGGLDLATAGTLTNSFIPSAATDWRKDTVWLNSFIGQNVLIKFVNICWYGNVLYLDNVNLDITTGLHTLNQSDHQIKLSPNPSNGLYTLNSNASDHTDYLIKVFDINGALIYTGVFPKNALSYELDIRSFAKGVYTMQLSGNNYLQHYKLISQ
jgi:PKD repeat protein